MSANINSSKRTVKLYEISCDGCGLARSRKDAIEASVDGVERFLCSECADRFGAISFEQVFGRAEFSIRDLIFSGEGGA